METRKVKAKVIMLPTKQSNIVKVHEYNSLHLLKGDEHPNNTILNLGIPQHLYFTTDEEIKEGDWYLRLGNNKIFRADDAIKHLNTTKALKIVATTDILLITLNEKALYNDSFNNVRTRNHLPQPSQAFVQKYCELGGIDEVDIELKSSDLDYFFGDLKVDSHNTITIHSIKDSWSREELTDILQVYRLDYEQYKRSCHYGPNQKEIVDWSNKWIKENL